MITSAQHFRRDQWKMLLAAMFCYLFFYTGRHNFGWAASDLAEDLGINYTQIGWISFSMLIGYAIGQLINGNLADRFSPRVMVALGGILSVVANFSISFSLTYTLILLFWAMNGYFQSMAWAPGSRLISNWWRKEERGKAFGMYTMAAGSSSVVTYFLSVLLINQEAHWRSLFRFPVLFLLLAVVVFFLVARSKPSDKGYPDLYHEGPRLPQPTWKERYAAVFGNRRFLIASIALGFESMARYGLIVWVPVHFLGNQGAQGANQIWASILMPIGMALGAFSFGTLSDTLFKGNRPASIRAGMLVASAVSLVIYFTPTTGPFAAGALMLLAGFFVYGPQANFWPMSPDLLGEKYVGTGIGVMNMCAYFFAAVGEPILGKTIDITGDTSSVFIVITVICAMSSIIISFCSYKKAPRSIPSLI
jgi:OPA family glycerol-3-phosphate transporter-like MFS transporter